MQTVTNKRPAERLNTHELLRDYMSKVNAACPLALVHHEQDAKGATLVIHVPSGNVAESDALAKLADQLTKLVASFPAPAVDTNEGAAGATNEGDAGEEIDETQKAVGGPLARSRKRKSETANDKSIEAST